MQVLGDIVTDKSEELKACLIRFASLIILGSLLANLLLFVCGLHVWLVTNEFEPNRVSSR